MVQGEFFSYMFFILLLLLDIICPILRNGGRILGLTGHKADNDGQTSEGSSQLCTFDV